MNDLCNFDPHSLASVLTEAGHRPVHVAKILRAFYANDGRLDPSGMNIGKSLTSWLARSFDLESNDSTRVLSRRSSADGTVKLLLGLAAGGSVETVLMSSHRAGRAMGCVSSQIGCAMGCDFCASTREGLERNLSAGEIVRQFIHLRRLAKEAGRKLTTLVFMGMGEPMHNLDNVLPAIRRIADPDLGGLGWRQVTVSTVGVVPGIERLAEADLNVHLAVSLHAPDDQTRSRIVPANRRYPVAEILEAARRFQEKTGRICTLEYCLLAGVNDSDEQALLLGRLLHRLRFHVNLIPYNPTGPGISGFVYARPSRERLVRFLDLLRDAGVVAHFRETRGDDVSAACGQLRQGLAVVT